MPLKKGRSQKVISENIRELYHSFRKRRYSKAKSLRMARGAAYSHARRKK